MRTLIGIVLWAIVGLSSASAQTSPGWPFGFVPTPAQWNAAFAGKMDYTGASACLITGCALTGELFLTASTANFASLNVPQGTAPTTPLDGDMWTTGGNLYVRLSGTTYQLTAGGCPTCALTTSANVFTAGPQVIQLNATTLPTALTGDVLEAASVDSTISRIDLIGFAASPNFTGRRADGTNASPTTVVSTDVLAAFNAHGYNGSAWTSTAAASIELQANQTWTTGANGTHIDVKTTINGSTASSLAIVCRFENDGGITCPNTVTGGDKGAGTINAAGLFVNGTAVSTGGTVTSVALTLPSSILTVSGSPVTNAGTLAATLATQTANLVWAGPAGGSAATPTFRALVAGDLPLVAGTGIQLTGTPNLTIALTSARQTLPTRQVFLTGSGTYTTPSNVLYIVGRIVGAGGGGGTTGSVAQGGTGGSTTFGPYTAIGGGGGVSVSGGAGGGFSGTAGYLQITGGLGGGAATNSEYAPGGMGCSTAFGGAGAAGGQSVGRNASANTGSGGGGGGWVNGTTNPGGGGGGCGGYEEFQINSPSATYSYSVGAGGAGGTAGGQVAGGNGGSGGIIIEEHYGS